MENEIILLDTSILIDFYRKKLKDKSAFLGLLQAFAISIITEYELLIGADAGQTAYWKGFFDRVIILPFDKPANDAAIAITKKLKDKNKLIEIPDIFIGATALSRNMKIATLNKKHFERISDLLIVSE